MTMGIVNAGQLGVYEKLDPELRERVEDVIFNRRADATERLVELAGDASRRARRRRRRTKPGARARVEERLAHALVNGITDVRRRRHRGGAASSTRGRSR